MSAKRKATAIMQHHKENISTPEPADITEDDQYSSALMKDAQKLKLMLIAWNYNLQQQAQAQAATAALSPNNSSTTTATTIGTPVTSQSAISMANNTINNSTFTDSRNGSAELGELSSAGIPSLGSVAGMGSEDMASLWASYTMGLKKTPPPASSMTPSRSDRDRESSPTGGEGTGSAQDETSSSGNKEDEDDDDEDSDERLDPRHHDPERLKAFNMFVRLFVDENLDRIVPISKQPKEKIQAIIDSCTRQFPEFAERARKRIRTYLKSCRRNKRGREGAPWDAARPTPAHLTSVQAEQILATACENESDNAKRMRLGLEPVSQPMPTLPAATSSDDSELLVGEWCCKRWCTNSHVQAQLQSGFSAGWTYIRATHTLSGIVSNPKFYVGIIEQRTNRSQYEKYKAVIKSQIECNGNDSRQTTDNWLSGVGSISPQIS
ncbi:nucleolar protein 4-like isoform X5 [Diachasmimorpha longicaudata]|uniref:nucleolar protein 4-like isoform X5 n=1 Tax=Diachasmimorpha longicaudata TaxID=58733 RepID=UPI0030B8757F